MNAQRPTSRRTRGKPRQGFGNTPHPNPLPYTMTGLLREYDVQRLASLGSVRLGSPRGERRTVQTVISSGTKLRRASNVPFYQTNPPILSWKTAVIRQCSNGLHNKMLPENGGFVLENEPTGMGFLRVVFIKVTCFPGNRGHRRSVSCGLLNDSYGLVIRRCSR